jgi:hypothetical protein
VRIHNLDMVVCCPAGTMTAVSVTQQWCCAATIERDSDRQGGRVDPPRRCLHALYSSARFGSLFTGHHHAARCVVTGLHAAVA